MTKNSPAVWDKVWTDPGLMTQDQLIICTEAASRRWQIVKRIVESEFKAGKNLKVLELGAGIGTYAGLFAQTGAKVTVLDYSTKALERAKVFFTANGLKARFIKGNALHLPSEVKNQKFDICVSVGLTEHFTDANRLKIHKSHMRVLKNGGLAIFLTPNQANLPYRLYKWCSEKLGQWKFGEEYPYSRAELLSLARQLGGSVVDLKGDDFYTSLRFLLPANFLRRWFGVGSPRKISEIKTEKGTFLDDAFGYCLMLFMKKT